MFFISKMHYFKGSRALGLSVRAPVVPICCDYFLHYFVDEAASQSKQIPTILKMCMHKAVENKTADLQSTEGCKTKRSEEA